MWQMPEMIYHGGSLCLWQGAEASKGPQASCLHRFCCTDSAQSGKAHRNLCRKNLWETLSLCFQTCQHVQLLVSFLEDGTKEAFVKAPGAPPSQALENFNSCWLSWYCFRSACPSGGFEGCCTCFAGSQKWAWSFFAADSNVLQNSIVHQLLHQSIFLMSDFHRFSSIYTSRFSSIFIYFHLFSRLWG